MLIFWYGVCWSVLFLMNLFVFVLVSFVVSVLWSLVMILGLLVVYLLSLFGLVVRLNSCLWLLLCMNMYF